MKQLSLIITAVTILGMLSLIEGCREETNEPIEVFTGDYIEYKVPDGFVEESYMAWWSPFPHRIDTISEETQEKRYDIGEQRYDFRYEREGKTGRLYVTERKRESIMMIRKIERRIILEAGVYYEWYEIKSDGIYLHGERQQELDDFTYTQTLTSSRTEGEEEKIEKTEGATTKANEIMSEISAGGNIYELTTLNENEIEIREMTPETIYLTTLQREK